MNRHLFFLGVVGLLWAAMSLRVDVIDIAEEIYNGAHESSIGQESSAGQMERTGTSGCKAIDSHGQSLRDMWEDELWKRCLSCGNDDGTVSDEDLENQFKQQVSKGKPCKGKGKGKSSCADIKASDGSQLCHTVKKFLFDTAIWDEGMEPHWNRQAYCVPCTPEPEDVVTMSFPGTYLKQLGGESWQPTDALCQAARVDDVTFELKLHSLMPGDYFLKAVINPEKNGWGIGKNYGAGGLPDGDNVHFRVNHDVVDTTLHFNTETNMFGFAFIRTSTSNYADYASFPGNYADQLGGENWDPTDALCQGERGEELWKNGAWGGYALFTLKLHGLTPGEYSFKAVIDPEKDRVKNGWADNYGVDGVAYGPDIKFTVDPDVLDTTLMFYTITKRTRVSFTRKSETVSD